MSKEAKSNLRLVLVLFLAAFIFLTTLGAAQPVAENAGVHPIVQVILSLCGGSGTFFFILKSYFATSKKNAEKSNDNERTNAQQEVLIKVITKQLEKLERKLDGFAEKYDHKIDDIKHDYAVLREDFTTCKAMGEAIHKNLNE